MKELFTRRSYIEIPARYFLGDCSMNNFRVFSVLLHKFILEIPLEIIAGIPSDDFKRNSFQIKHQKFLLGIHPENSFGIRWNLWANSQMDSGINSGVYV